MVKWSKIITQQPENIENPNIIRIKSSAIEHINTSLKLSKIIKQDKKFLQVVGAGKNFTTPL